MASLGKELSFLRHVRYLVSTAARIQRIEPTTVWA